MATNLGGVGLGGVGLGLGIGIGGVSDSQQLGDQVLGLAAASALTITRDGAPASAP